MLTPEQHDVGLRERIAQLEARLGEMAETIESIAETGITETILRAHDGFVKIGRGCLVVREEEYLALRAAQEGES